MKEAEYTLHCSCRDPEHMLIFREWETLKGYMPKLQIFMQMYPYLVWWKRIVPGIKYIVGLEFRQPHWSDCLVVDWDDIQGLINFLEGLKVKYAKDVRDKKREVFDTIALQAQQLRDYKKLIEMTRLLDCHPDGYDGPCECQACTASGD